ncbi:hypothetical protein CR513_49458, partial [Mucuna pruriens]
MERGCIRGWGNFFKLCVLFPPGDDKLYQRQSDRETSLTEFEVTTLVTYERFRHTKPVEDIGLQKIHYNLGIIAIKAESISVQKEHLDPEEVVQDQDLGSLKLSEVIARYSRRTLVDGNLNVWPSLVHHYRPSIGDRRGRQTLWKTSEPLHAFDLEIKRTLHRLRKARHTITPNSSSSDFIWNSENSNFTIDKSNFFEHQEAGSMENNDRTLKELATTDVVYQPWCIQCPPLEPAQSYELKSSLIHLLPKFHGLAGEDPHKHLKEFHVVCSTTRPQGISEDHIKIEAFPFSLDGAAKDWLYLQPVLFNTCGDMKRMFL